MDDYKKQKNLFLTQLYTEAKMQFWWMNYQVENYQAFFYSTGRQNSNLCLASALSVHIFRGPWLGRLLGSEKKRSGTSFFSHRFWHVGILKGVGGIP